MCLLIVKPAGEKLNREHLLNGSLNNSDGMGVAYVKDKKLVVEKGWTNFDNFFTFLQTIEELEMVIHFRAASAGMDVSADMTHPFEIKNTMFHIGETEQPRFFFAIAHNGRLDWRSTKEHSDTYCFIEDILSPSLNRDPWFLDHNPGRVMLSRTIKDTNKMAIMKYDAELDKALTVIINPDGGWGQTSSGHGGKAHYLGKTWYSNYSYEAPKPKFVYTSSGYQHGNYGGGYMSQGMLAALAEAESDGWMGNMGGEVGNGQSAETTSPFAKPDENGWLWDFGLDKWRNVKTGTTCDVLTSRPVRPVYMTLRERNKAQSESQKRLTVGDMAEMRKDDDLLSEEEWKRKRGITLEGDIDITVPRDDDVIDHELENAKGLSHLNKNEKRILRRAAADYVRHVVGKKGKREYSNAEMICWLRSDYRDMYPHLRNLNDEDFDHWVIKMVKDGRRVDDLVDEITATAGMN